MIALRNLILKFPTIAVLCASCPKIFYPPNSHIIEGHLCLIMSGYSLGYKEPPPTTTSWLAALRELDTCHLRATHPPRTLSENHQVRKIPNPNTYKPQSDWASLKKLIPRGSDACYLWRLCFFQTVRRRGLEHPRGIVDRRVTEFVKVRKSPEDLPWVIGRGLCNLSSRRIQWGLGVLSCVLSDWVSGTVCPRV